MYRARGELPDGETQQSIIAREHWTAAESGAHAAISRYGAEQRTSDGPENRGGCVVPANVSDRRHLLSCGKPVGCD